jgi:hypothetical protein
MRPDVSGLMMEASPFTSIPVAFWWAIVTMATVGYGDMYPTTEWGRLVGSFVIVCGLVIIALPITILGANYTDEYARYRAEIRLGGDGFSMNLHELQLLDQINAAKRDGVLEGDGSGSGAAAPATVAAAAAAEAEAEASKGGAAAACAAASASGTTSAPPQPPLGASSFALNAATGIVSSSSMESSADDAERTAVSAGASVPSSPSLPRTWSDRGLRGKAAARRPLFRDAVRAVMQNAKAGGASAEVPSAAEVDIGRGLGPAQRVGSLRVLSETSTDREQALARLQLSGYVEPGLRLRVPSASSMSSVGLARGAGSFASPGVLSEGGPDAASIGEAVEDDDDDDDDDDGGNGRSGGAAAGAAGGKKSRPPKAAAGTMVVMDRGARSELAGAVASAVASAASAAAASAASAAVDGLRAEVAANMASLRAENAWLRTALEALLHAHGLAGDGRSGRGEGMLGARDGSVSVPPPPSQPPSPPPLLP